MLSDVPLGAFLSGGIDSSTIVALMQSQSSTPVRTFSIGFSEGAYDESPFARRVAIHLGTDHTELQVRATDALDLVPQLSRIYDEPFADSSQLPTTLVARMARQHVTVALSGDAGDEIFCGYPHYFLGPRLASGLARTPQVVRASAAVAIRMMGNLASDRLYKAADLLGGASHEALYHRLVSYWWMQPVVLGAPLLAPGAGTEWPADTSFVRQMMRLDTVAYLPDDILVKVDRAAMSVSLETRVPMLDPRVFELAWRLPLDFHLRNGGGKWLLRRLLHRYVPAPLVERPKMGFSIPLGAWLRGPLREWAEGLLDVSRMKAQGFLDSALVHRRWNEHIKGVRNWPHELWNVLMFQAWLQANR
jgi:asparagine synthase (glutamine-hydrolysing)